MNDLAEWLLQQIAEDERGAREAVKGAGGQQWEVSGGEFNTVRVEVRDAANADPSYDDGEGWYPPLVYDEGACGEEPAAHIARWDPARVLAECDAKRRVVERCAPLYNDYQTVAFAGDMLRQDWDGQPTKHGVAVFTLYDLALPYADRPGYLEEWRS